MVFNIRDIEVNQMILYDSYHEMNLKRLCIVQYINDDAKIIGMNHMIQWSLIFFFFHQFPWEIKKSYKLKLLN